MKGKGRKVPARLGREPAEQPLLPGAALSLLRASALAPRPGWGRPGVRPRGDSRQRETGIGVGASGRTRAMSPGLPGRLGGDRLPPGPAAASAAGTGRWCMAPAGKVPLLCNGAEVLSLPGAGCRELAAGSGPGRLPKAGTSPGLARPFRAGPLRASAGCRAPAGGRCRCPALCPAELATPEPPAVPCFPRSRCGLCREPRGGRMR